MGMGKFVVQAHSGQMSVLGESSPTPWEPVNTLPAPITKPSWMLPGPSLSSPPQSLGAKKEKDVGLGRPSKGDQRGQEQMFWSQTDLGWTLDSFTCNSCDLRHIL